MMRFLFYSIGFTLGILSLIVEADLGIIESKLQEKNCLPWANAD
jgi:hypothetical protein